MKIFRPAKLNRAMTLVEVLVVVVVVTIIAAFYLMPPLAQGPARSPRIQCLNNLKQVGLAARVWEGDNENKFPWSIAQTNGGSMEFTAGPNLWRHFQVMSNELSTPKVLTCPADDRLAATNFTYVSNSNISFFLGIGVTSENTVNALFAGDRNITNGLTIKNAMLDLPPDRPAGWTSEMHNKVGNILLADGSIQQLSIADLRSLIGAPQFTMTSETTMATNAPATAYLQMPVVGF